MLRNIVTFCIVVAATNGSIFGGPLNWACLSRSSWSLYIDYNDCHWCISDHAQNIKRPYFPHELCSQPALPSPLMDLLVHCQVTTSEFSWCYRLLLGSVWLPELFSPPLHQTFHYHPLTVQTWPILTRGRSCHYHTWLTSPVSWGPFFAKIVPSILSLSLSNREFSPMK